MGDSPVLFLSYAGIPGGAARILLDCATRSPYPVLVACPEGGLADAARAAGLEVVPLADRPVALHEGPRAAARHACGLAGLARETVRLAHRHRPRVLVAWGARAVLATCLPRAARRLPPVLAVHHDLLLRPVVAPVVRLATRLADGVAADSEAIAARLRSRRAVAVLQPGVDLAHWTPAPTPAPEPPRALSLGALVPWKRADLALDVAARMPDLQLTIAGATIPGDDGSFEAKLRARAAQPDLLGRVDFVGHVEDPRPLLARAHALLHCADAEPFGVALVEALAAGRPVVAPAGGGPLEIVGDGGELFPPGDPDAAAAALRAVLADPDAGRRARARAEASFSVERSAARLAVAVQATTR